MSSLSSQKICLHEPARDLPVVGAYDVIVAGGGIAGVAAALAAARAGCRVALLEKYCTLGGLATVGNVTHWLPICDGRGRQVIAGLSEELLHLSVADLGAENRAASFIPVPDCWKPGGDLAVRKRVRFASVFNPAAYAFGLEKAVVDAGIHLLYDTHVAAVHRENGCISHVIAENKSGRWAMGCRTAVDATGDADLCVFAGEPTVSLDTNVACGWFYTYRDGALKIHKQSRRHCPVASREGAQGPFFRGDDGDHVTAQILTSRADIRDRLEQLRSETPGVDVQLIMPPTLACFRMTRRLDGEHVLSAADVHQWVKDAVALTGDWRKAGPVYAIPMRSLRAVKNRNLVTAGRCMSAEGRAWDVVRAIPACAVTGEAAGAAAAMAVRETGGDIHALDIGEFQAGLRAQGMLIDPALVAEAPVPAD